MFWIVMDSAFDCVRTHLSAPPERGEPDVDGGVGYVLVPLLGEARGG